MTAAARAGARVPPGVARGRADERTRTVALSAANATSVATIVDALPDPNTLAPGTLVVVLGELAGARSLTRSVLAVFGRDKPVARVLRCSALVARGYVDVGAADDAGADLAWGYVADPP